MDMQIELIKALAEQQGEYVLVTHEDVILKNDCPTCGGTYFANTPLGKEEAIAQLTYEALNPLRERNAQ